MKQHLTSVIAARQKSPSNFLNARWIVGVLCIILISAFPDGGSANPSPADLSTETPTFTPTVGLPATIIIHTYTPTETPTGTATVTATPTLTTTPTFTITPTWTPPPTHTPIVTPSKVPPPNDPMGSQQILVSTDDVLYVYTKTGELLESYDIPYPIEPQPITEYARDIIPGPDSCLLYTSPSPRD